ncbi:MAG TPA: hypothetical protein VF998_10585 [Candidatus Limnocylindria bacterium]
MGLGLRVGSIAALTFAFAVALAAPAAAIIDGGCTATASATKSGSVDLTTASEWHLKTDDVVSGSGTAPSDQTFVQISAYALGVPIPILNGTGKGKSGSAGPYAVSSYSWMAKTIVVSGASDSCNGSITIIIDDTTPVATASGGGGAIVALIGLAGMVLSAMGPGGRGGRVAGGLSGVLTGLGLGLLAQQLGVLDARSLVGLALPAAGAVIGIGAAGALHRGGSRPGPKAAGALP